MDFTSLGRGMAQPIRMWFFFPTKGLDYRFISCLGGWSQTIPRLKTDVEVLGWRGYMWSAVARPVGHTAKFSKMTFQVTYGREIGILFSGNSSGGHSCSQHVNCFPPQLEASVVLWQLHNLKWPFMFHYVSTCLCLNSSLHVIPHCVYTIVMEQEDQLATIIKHWSKTSTTHILCPSIYDRICV
jgi:hypothetical protein